METIVDMCAKLIERVNVGSNTVFLLAEDGNLIFPENKMYTTLTEDKMSHIPCAESQFIFRLRDEI